MRLVEAGCKEQVKKVALPSGENALKTLLDNIFKVFALRTGINLMLTSVDVAGDPTQMYCIRSHNSAGEIGIDERRDGKRWMRQVQT